MICIVGHHHLSPSTIWTWAESTPVSFVQKEGCIVLHHSGTFQVETPFLTTFWHVHISYKYPMSRVLLQIRRSYSMSYENIREWHHFPCVSFNPNVPVWAVIKTPLGWITKRGWKSHQIYTDYFISHYNDPFINQRVFHGMLYDPVTYGF